MIKCIFVFPWLLAIFQLAVINCLPLPFFQHSWITMVSPLSNSIHSNIMHTLPFRAENELLFPVVLWWNTLWSTVYSVKGLWCTFSLRSALFLLQPSWMRVSLFVKSTSEKDLILVDSLLYGLENHSYPFRFLYQKEIRTECHYWPPLSCQNDISFAGGNNTSL